MEGNLHPLATEYTSVASLVPHPDNPRRGRVDAIAESLSTTGQYRPIVVSRATGHVLAGNHTLRAAIQLGWEKIAVTYLDGLSPDQERRILLADNRTADMGSYDDDALLQVLADLAETDSLAGTGYTLDDFEDLQALVGATEEVAAPRTDAHWNEDEKELEERAERLGAYQPLKGQNLAEVVLIMTTEKREQFHLWLERLRQEWGAELTNGEVAHAAVARIMESLNGKPSSSKTSQPLTGVTDPFGAQQ